VLVEMLDQVMAYLAQGRKIEAIEQLRKETGLGLAEAKRAVDEIEGP
jgi:ribosomal protein L7/L12